MLAPGVPALKSETVVSVKLAGGVTVKELLAGVGSVLLAASVARTSKVWGPAASEL